MIKNKYSVCVRAKGKMEIAFVDRYSYCEFSCTLFYSNTHALTSVSLFFLLSIKKYSHGFTSVVFCTL